MPDTMPDTGSSAVSLANQPQAVGVAGHSSLRPASCAGMAQVPPPHPQQPQHPSQTSSQPQPQQQLVLAVDDEPLLIPPLNFSMVSASCAGPPELLKVAPGVYRSGYPNKKNHGFMK